MTGRTVSVGGHSELELAGVLTGLTVVGMAVGTWMHLVGPQRDLGWVVFIISFGAWMGAAILLMLMLWDAGFLDR